MLNNTFPISQLPEELQAYTFNFLDSKNQSLASLVCHDWHRIILDRERLTRFIANKNKMEKALYTFEQNIKHYQKEWGKNSKLIGGIFIFALAFYLYNASRSSEAHFPTGSFIGLALSFCFVGYLYYSQVSFFKNEKKSTQDVLKTVDNISESRIKKDA